MAGIGNMKPVKLLHYTVAQNADGDNVETLAARHRMWAEVTDGGGNRSMERSAVTLGKTRTFLIHYRPDWVLNGDWRVKYNGKEYAITGIERVNEKRFNWRITGIGKD